MSTTLQQSYVKQDRGRSQNEAVLAVLVEARGGHPELECKDDEGWVNLLTLVQKTNSLNVHSRCAQVRGMIDPGLDIDQENREADNQPSTNSSQPSDKPPRSWYRICRREDSKRLKRSREGGKGGEGREENRVQEEMVL